MDIRADYVCLIVGMMAACQAARAQTNPAVNITFVQDSAGDRRTLSSQNTVAPGEFLTLYGTGLGPTTGVPALPLNTGFPFFYPTEISGTKVYFDGKEAQLLYASSTQVNALAPYDFGATDKATKVQVVSASGQSQVVTLDLAPANPYVFAVLNEDGTVNGSQGCARQDSVITLLVSGAGSVAYCRDARNCPPVLPVNVRVSPGEFCATAIQLPTYVGATEGAALNLLKIVVPLPGRRCNSGSGTIQVAVGATVSPEFHVCVF